MKEKAAGFCTLNLQEMGAWVQQLGQWGAICIGEAACKEQFNVIPPSSVIDHIHQAAAWGKHSAHGGLPPLVSVHRTNKKLDQPGEGKRGIVSIMSMAKLISIVEFSWTQDHVVVAAGDL